METNDRNSDVSTISDTIFGDLYDPFAIPRKKMIPNWMKFFCYFFILLGTLSIVGLLLPRFYLSIGSIKTGGTEIALYGLHEINELSIMAAAIVGLFVLKAIVGYVLLAEKDWAIKIGMIDGGLGILICCLTMFVLPFFGWDFHFSWELFFLLPYQARLWRIRLQWEENSFGLQERLGMDQST
jgi:hypothetical protein